MSQHYVQLTFFPETAEERAIRELKEIRTYQKNVARSQYAKIAEVKRENTQLRHEFEMLKSALCRYQQIEQKQYDFMEKLA